MENISMNQALQVWSQLWQAYFGKNGFGGDTAEIYAYIVMPYAPTLQASGFEEDKKEIYLRAARSLYELIAKFCRENNCQAEINGQPFGDWFLAVPFEHRCQVKIIH